MEDTPYLVGRNKRRRKKRGKKKERKNSKHRFKSDKSQSYGSPKHTC